MCKILVLLGPVMIRTAIVILLLILVPLTPSWTEAREFSETSPSSGRLNEDLDLEVLTACYRAAKIAKALNDESIELMRQRLYTPGVIYGLEVLEARGRRLTKLTVATVKEINNVAQDTSRTAAFTKALDLIEDQVLHTRMVINEVDKSELVRNTRATLNALVSDNSQFISELQEEGDRNQRLIRESEANIERIKRRQAERDSRSRARRDF